MSAGNPDPLLTGPHDPEHDPTRVATRSSPSYAAAADPAGGLDHRGETVVVSLAAHRAAAGPRAAVEPTTTSREAFAPGAARADGLGADPARPALGERCCGFHDLVLDRQDEILDLIVWESGKARKHALRRAAARRADRPLLRPHRPPSTSTPSAELGVVPGLTRVDVNQVPKGVVGIISPWNYPFTLALCDGLPALLAGNAVVAKPDAQTHADRAARRRSCSRRPGFPRDLWQVVAGAGREVGGRDRRATPTTSASPARPRPAGWSRRAAPSG